MKEERAPQTRANERKIPISEALNLSVQDNLQQVIQKGLYTTPQERPVVIFDGPEVVAIAAAGKLRGEILPRAWSGVLGARLANLSPPPEITAQTRLAGLGFLVQDVPEVEWLLVVNDEMGQPVGIIPRTDVLACMPPPEETSRVLRSASLVLWGDPGVEHDYFYCPVEGRYYAPHAVFPDQQGRMRDRRGHLVEKRTPPTAS